MPPPVESRGTWRDVARRRARRLTRTVAGGGFDGSAGYWDARYAAGGDSGAGSYGRNAAYKAAFLNRFVAEHRIDSVIEFGCGDGNQLSLARYPRYLGLDVSPNAIAICRERFAGDTTKSFLELSDYAGERAELALSLDVVFHLVEDDVFDRYMRTLFDAAERYVIVYSTNSGGRRPLDRPHVRHRRFTDWTARRTDWRLAERARRTEFDGLLRRAAFHVFERA